MPEIELQQTTPTMAPLLAKLHSESFEKECWSLDQIKGSLDLSTTIGWVAIKNNHAVGFILCQKAEPTAEILTFCVCPDLRKNGIGSVMVKHALKNLPLCKSIYLEVAADNIAAIKLYEKCGFTKTSERKNYYKREQDFVDAFNYSFFIS